MLSFNYLHIKKEKKKCLRPTKKIKEQKIGNACNQPCHQYHVVEILWINGVPSLLTYELRVDHQGLLFDPHGEGSLSVLPSGCFLFGRRLSLGCIFFENRI